ncbi:MAG: amino acid adenylation domain-containing protein, partial [Comamonadaceae bacterium]
LQARLFEFGSQGFDVTDTLPVRARLFRIGADDHMLVMVMHHIASDGASTLPLARDIMAAYAARREGVEPQWPELPVQYADYAIWQRALLGSEDDPESLAAQQIDFWSKTLAGVPDVLELPTDRPRPAQRSMAGGTVGFTVDADLHRRLGETAREHNVSLFMVLHAALSVLLARLSSTTDIAIGTAIAGRGHEALDNLVGMFVNTLVLRTEVEPGASFSALLGQVREQDLKAFSHQDVPFEQLVDALKPARSTAYTPLFQVVLTHQVNGIPALEFAGLEATPGAVDVEFSKFDLTVDVQEEWSDAGVPTGITGSFGYATEIFDSGTVQGFVDRFVRILAAVATGADIAVGDIPILDPQETAELTPVRGLDGVSPQTLTELLADAVAANPDGAAIIAGGDSITYRELDEWSNRVARILIERGVGAETFVGLAITRSIASIVGIWAVVKSGGAYVPVDPRYPDERIAHMVTDSGVSLGLSVSSEVGRLPVDVDWLVLDSEEFANASARYSKAPLVETERRTAMTPANSAYVIYTSGTTGRPKGVVVTHRGLANFAAEQRERYGIDTTSRTLHFASPSFDASVLELLMATPAGATMVIAPADMYGGEELKQLISTEQVTHAFATPAVLASLDPTGLQSLEVVVTGGEACPRELADRWSSSVQMFNAYGPTEATVMTNLNGPMTVGERVTIGGPVRGSAALVLDARLRPTPLGVSGELYVSGAALARGYHARAGLSASRFVANPFDGPGSRMYRTGDVVRWLHAESGDLTLDYVGRSDLQVKVRGFRIELGEIDAVLASHPGIDFATTSVVPGPTGDPTLVSHVLVASGADLDENVVLDFVGTFVPGYMVPTAIVAIEALPLTPAGKINRQALPQPNFHEQAHAFRAPVTQVETTLASIFADVLGTDRNVGLDDDFFMLGGNSIAATRLVSRLNAALSTDLGVRVLFEAPTVAGLARRVAEHGSGSATRPALVPRLRPDRIPLSLAQQRMWFANRFDPASPSYNIPLALRLSGALDVEALRRALRDVFERHESLRTEFPNSPEGPYQVVRSAGDLDLGLPLVAVSDEQELQAKVIAFGTTGFDVTKSVPVRAALFRLESTEHVVVI